MVAVTRGQGIEADDVEPVLVLVALVEVGGRGGGGWPQTPAVERVVDGGLQLLAVAHGLPGKSEKKDGLVFPVSAKEMKIRKSES